MESARGACATIDLAALRANLGIARACAGGRALIAVVKADAYGHGAARIAHELVAAGTPALAVSSVDEVAELRDAGLRVPILALGGAVGAAAAAELVARDASIVLHQEEDARLVAEAARAAGAPARVQIEIDTGMRRMGVAETGALALATRVAEDASLVLEGVFSHFACADDPDLAFSLEQCARLRAALDALRDRGVLPPQIHIANSAGLLARELVAALPEATAVRPGLMLYGVRPAPHLGARAPQRLSPVMTFCAPVLRVHSVCKGESVGYGASFVAERDTRVATLGVGYADGLSWGAGGRGSVWLAGAERPIAGRVSMDSVGVEIGDADVALGDRAILFGPSPGGERGGRAVEDVAAECDTLAYELLVRVGRRVERRYRDGPETSAQR